MNFLAPLFLGGLAAIGIPVVIHLINRERKVVVEFPSLMFLQKIPYRSVRRQKIRHLVLLVMRCVALALLAAAFARPFFDRRANTVATTGAREVVILLDRSASMGYAGRWRLARDAAKKVISGLQAGDHATLVTFAADATVATEPMATPERMLAALNTTKLSDEATRYAPAIKLASQIEAASSLPRREVYFISDFQKTGWANHNEVGVPAGTDVFPVDVGLTGIADVGVMAVTSDRDSTGERDKITVAARVVNTGSAPRPISAVLTIAGRDVQTRREMIAPGARQLAFAPVVIPNGATRASVHITPDSLAADDEFNVTLAPDEAVSVLVVEPASPRANQSLYLERALAIGDRPTFRVTEKSIGELTPRDIDGRALIVLDEVAPPAGENGKRLRAVVESGAGLFFAPGSLRIESWPSEWRTLLPATAGEVVDRTADAGGTLSSVDYSNPIFEIFNAPRSGDFSTARFLRYRALAPQPGGNIAARFDDGAPALIERVVGSGRVVMWASTLDNSWTNLPLQPVFLPFVHQIGKHVGRYADPRPSFVAGDVLDISRHSEMTAAFLGGRTADSVTELVLQAPSGARERVTASGPNHLVMLHERGFYELRGRDTPIGSGRPIAVNVDASEADLSHVDPQDVVLAITSASAQRAAGADVNTGTPQDRERRQKIWWYLLFAALILMGAETALSNRLSKAAA